MRQVLLQVGGRKRHSAHVAHVPSRRQVGGRERLVRLKAGNTGEARPPGAAPQARGRRVRGAGLRRSGGGARVRRWRSRRWRRRGRGGCDGHTVHAAALQPQVVATHSHAREAGLAPRHAPRVAHVPELGPRVGVHAPAHDGHDCAERVGGEREVAGVRDSALPLSPVPLSRAVVGDGRQQAPLLAENPARVCLELGGDCARPGTQDVRHSGPGVVVSRWCRGAPPSTRRRWRTPPARARTPRP